MGRGCPSTAQQRPAPARQVELVGLAMVLELVGGPAQHRPLGKPQKAQQQGGGWSNAPQRTDSPDPHGNVRLQGWAASLLVDRPILHSNRNRPYYMGARGQCLCAIACTAPFCPYRRAPCNFTIRDMAQDFRMSHECSFCQRDRKARQRTAQDDA